MTKLPALSAQKVIRVLKKKDFIELRQKGSHLVMYCQSTNARTVVPVHPGKDIKGPLLKAIISDAKLSEKEFLELL